MTAAGEGTAAVGRVIACRSTLRSSKPLYLVAAATPVVGVAAASIDRSAVLLTGIAGLVAGAMSMAAGEYVSVSSQADTEHADLERERVELEENEEHEIRELAMIYQQRGLDADLARRVATEIQELNRLLDEVAVYDKVLDAATILAHFNAASSSSGTPPTIVARNPADGAGDAAGAGRGGHAIMPIDQDLLRAHFGRIWPVHNDAFSESEEWQAWRAPLTTFIDELSRKS